MNKSDEQKIIDMARDLGIKKPRVVSDISIQVPKDLELEHQVEDGTIKGKGWTMRRKAPKVCGNEPCSCGSGKKSKKCCYSPYKK